MIARAEDDRLLQRIAIACCEQAREEMFAHRFDAFWHNESRFQRTALAFRSDRLRGDGSASERIRQLLVRYIGAINSADTLALIFVVVIDVVLLDVRRSEIAILDALHVRIFIRRFTKVIVVIGQLTLVLFDALLGFLVLDFPDANVTRCGC